MNSPGELDQPRHTTLSPEVARALKAYVNRYGGPARTGRAVGVARQFVQMLVAGTAAPSVTVANELVKVLGMSEHWGQRLVGEAVAGRGYDRPELIKRPGQGEAQAVAELELVKCGECGTEREVWKN